MLALFLVGALFAEGVAGGSLQVEVYSMRRYLKYGVAALCVLGSGPASAAVVFQPLAGGVTPEAMVASLLSSSSGITINSVTYTGSNAASGQFTNGNSSGIGINSGITLSTGYLSDVASGFDDDNGTAGNPALEAYNGGQQTNNASTLEISFTPTGNQIAFSYVFASREYPDFVNSQYNDVFAFLVNGTNFALIPGSDDFVSINNVNCGDENGNGPSNCNLFNDNRDGSISGLDVGGFTDLFDFTAPVNAGVVNTLVLSIADTTDDILDSIVFLAGGTLQVCGGPDQPPCEPPPPPPGEVPEPAAIGLLGLGALALGLRRRRR
jgi:hypothetical protein